VDGDRFADLIAQRDNGTVNRVDLFWVEATNPAGTAWAAPILLGNVPRSEHSEGFQGYRVAQLVPGRAEIAVSTMRGLYFRRAKRAAAGSWPERWLPQRFG
jgi:hypothetical protein